MTSKDCSDETAAASTDGNQPLTEMPEPPADDSIDRLGDRSDADRFAAVPDRSTTADTSRTAFGSLGLGPLSVAGRLVVPDRAGVLSGPRRGRPPDVCPHRRATFRVWEFDSSTNRPRDRTQGERGQMPVRDADRARSTSEWGKRDSTKVTAIG